jgi:hypothetical protein
MLVILYYDHALTLHMEIQRFWIRGSFTWATFFFFLNRYLAFLGHIPVIVQSFWDPSDLSHKFTVSIYCWLEGFQHLNVFIADVSPDFSLPVGQV